MSTRARLLVGAFVSLTAAPAFADGIAYDACEEVGKSCHNAVAGHRADDPTAISSPGQAVEDGECENAKCWSKGPPPSVSEDCLRCIESDSGCSCRAGGIATHRSLAALMLFLGVGALAWSRRRN